MSVNLVPRMALVVFVLSVLGLLIIMYNTWLTSTSVEALYHALGPAVEDLTNGNITADLRFDGEALVYIDKAVYPVEIGVNVSILSPGAVAGGALTQNITLYSGLVNGTRLVIELIGAGSSEPAVFIDKPYVKMYADGNRTIIEPRIVVKRGLTSVEDKIVTVDTGGVAKQVRVLVYHVDLIVEYYKFRSITAPSGVVSDMVYMGDGFYNIHFNRIRSQDLPTISYTVDVYLNVSDLANVYALYSVINGEYYVLYNDIFGELRGLNLALYDYVNVKFNVYINKYNIDVVIARR